MKRYPIYIILILLVASCFQDESTLGTFEYPDIIITQNFTGDTLNIAFGDYLSISADAVQEGVDDEDLEYLWEQDVQAGSSKDRAFLSNTHSVEERITLPPATQPYYISLTVTNRQTGYCRIKYWPMFVINNLGEGLLIAHTADGGATSELTLLASSTLTYGYVSDTPRVTDNLWELGNEEHISGKVTNILARTASDLNAPVRASFNEDLLMIATENDLYALNPVNYAVKKSNYQLFNTTSVSSFNVEWMANVGSYSSFVLIDGVPYVCVDMLDNCYSSSSYPPATGMMHRNNTTACADDQGWIYTFDPVFHKIYYLPGWCAASASFSELEDTVSPSVSFLSDKTCVACGILKGLRGAFILTDGSSYWLAVTDGFNRAAPVVAQMDAPGIKNAVEFAFCDNTDVVFYTDGAKVYSTVLSGGNATTRTLSWTPDSPDEKVTMIRHYRQAWYGTHKYSSSNYGFPISTHRLQIVVITYNEKTGEGKIYLKPFNVSTGMFSAFKDNGTYGGFNEITAIGTTLR